MRGGLSSRRRWQSDVSAVFGWRCKFACGMVVGRTVHDFEGHTVFYDPGSTSCVRRCSIQDLMCRLRDRKPSLPLCSLKRTSKN